MFRKQNNPDNSGEPKKISKIEHLARAALLAGSISAPGMAYSNEKPTSANDGQPEAVSAVSRSSEGGSHVESGRNRTFQKNIDDIKRSFQETTIKPGEEEIAKSIPIVLDNISHLYLSLPSDFENDPRNNTVAMALSEIKQKLDIFQGRLDENEVSHSERLSYLIGLLGSIASIFSVGLASRSNKKLEESRQETRESLRTMYEMLLGESQKISDHGDEFLKGIIVGDKVQKEKIGGVRVALSVLLKSARKNTDVSAINFDIYSLENDLWILDMMENLDKNKDYSALFNDYIARDRNQLGNEWQTLKVRSDTDDIAIIKSLQSSPQLELFS